MPLKKWNQLFYPERIQYSAGRKSRSIAFSIFQSCVSFPGELLSACHHREIVVKKLNLYVNVFPSFLFYYYYYSLFYIHVIWVVPLN